MEKIKKIQNYNQKSKNTLMRLKKYNNKFKILQIKVPILNNNNNNTNYNIKIK